MPHSPAEPPPVDPAAPRFSDELPGLVDALGLLCERLRPVAAAEHAMVVPSAMQADQTARRIYEWTTGGEVGPMPRIAKAEHRSIAYLSSSTTAKIRAFVSVNATALFELSDQTKASFSAGHWLVALGNCRGMMERVAVAIAFRNVVEKGLRKPPDPNESAIAAITEISESVTKFLYGTRRDWTKLVDADFNKVARSEVE